ncbi:MAG: hypothetical protein AAF950_06835 [Pseudomonadota bacterium]
MEQRPTRLEAFQHLSKLAFDLLAGDHALGRAAFGPAEVIRILLCLTFAPASGQRRVAFRAADSST